MKKLNKKLILPLILLSAVAFAEIVYDREFYSDDFMASAPEVNIEVKIEAPAPVKKVAKKPAPRVQRVDLDQAGKVNGKWEIVRILNEELIPVYDKNTRIEDENSEIIVDLELISLSTVRVNDDADQTFSISMMTSRGTMALFKPFGNGYEVLEARRVVEKKEALAASAVASAPKQTKIEKRFEMNQELVLKSALNPTQSGEVMKGSKVTGSIYLMGDQVMFENISLSSSNGKQTETLSFEARLDGNTGHINYNNEIQGIVSVVGDKEVRVRFSTGPLANAMLNFMVPGSDYNDGDDYEIEQRGGRPTAPLITSNISAEGARARITASQQTDDEIEEYQEEEYSDEDGYDQEEGDIPTEEAGYEF